MSDCCGKVFIKIADGTLPGGVLLLKHPIAQRQPQQPFQKEEKEAPEANLFEPLDDLCFSVIIDRHNVPKIQIFRIDKCILTTSL